MNENNIVGKTDGTSKLELLRQKRGIKKTEEKTDIGKAIEGFAASIDSQKMMEKIARNSAIVNLIIDGSGSMDGTSKPISQEINGFASRQAAKVYTTKISLTVFDDEVYPQFNNVDTRQFIPISPWYYGGNTNIYDAIFSAISDIAQAGVNHKIHLIITDGANGRSIHTQEEVQKLIRTKIQGGEHIFLLYNDEEAIIDVQDYAAELGIKSNNAVTFNRNGDGIKIIFQTIEDVLDGLRTKGVVPDDWSKAITAHAANPLGVKARETLYLE